MELVVMQHLQVEIYQEVVIMIIEVGYHLVGGIQALSALAERLIIIQMVQYLMYFYMLEHIMIKYLN